MENKITVVIQTRNEAASIVECIESAKQLSSDILLIDMESTDETVALANSMAVQIKTFPYSRYVEPARQFGIEQATGEWVLILDADERLTPELIAEIKKCVSLQAATHYKIARKNIFGQKYWLQHGGWWPDHQLRLIKKSAFKTWPARIHATPEISGELGYIATPITHFFHGDVAGMVVKTTQFEDIEASLLYKAQRPVSVGTFFRKFFGELYRRLLKHQGYLDGRIGILEAIYQAYSKTITWIYLYEKKKSRPV